MEKNYKPSGHNSVSPYLVVQDSKKMINLLKEIFSATIARYYEEPDGSVMHAEVKIDDSIVMLGESSEKFPPNQHLIHVYVPDVEDIMDKAIKAGCKLLQAPRKKEGDPDRRGSFQDFAGNIWSVATQI